MFRKEALRKGHLKPIHAQIGTMVGQTTTAAPVPALRKPPTFMERMSVSTPARFAKSIFNIPFAGGYYGGEKVAEGLGIKNPLLQMPFGMTGGYLASKALPGLASLPAATSAALPTTACAAATPAGRVKSAEVKSRRFISGISLFVIG